MEDTPVLDELTRALLTVDELVRLNEDVELEPVEVRRGRFAKDENLELTLPVPEVLLETLELVEPERLDKEAKTLATFTVPPDTCSSSSFFMISRIILILQI
jgi:hypothetical protein